MHNSVFIVYHSKHIKRMKKHHACNCLEQAKSLALYSFRECAKIGAENSIESQRQGENSHDTDDKTGRGHAHGAKDQP